MTTVRPMMTIMTDITITMATVTDSPITAVDTPAAVTESLTDEG